MELIVHSPIKVAPDRVVKAGETIEPAGVGLSEREVAELVARGSVSVIEPPAALPAIEPQPAPAQPKKPRARELARTSPPSP